MTTNNELKLYDKNVVFDYITKTTKIKHRDRKQKNRQDGSNCRQVSK